MSVRGRERERGGSGAGSCWAVAAAWAKREGREFGPPGERKGEGRGWRAGPACQGPEGRRGWGSGLGSVRAEIQGGGEVFFFFFFLIQNLFQIHFKIYLKYFQTLVKNHSSQK